MKQLTTDDFEQCQYCLAPYRVNILPGHIEQSWRCLVADIGGTNARFAIIDQAGGRVRAQAVLACADYPGPAEAVEAYLANIDGPRPRRAGIAVATAVTGDRFRLTNHAWDFCISELQRTLQLDQLLVINDFTALAFALPYLTDAEVEQIGSGRALTGQPMAVLGPGTGLGVSGLLTTHGDLKLALEGEGGHVAFSPATERESDILRLLRSRFQHVSAERVLSGPGLRNIYRALCELDGQSPADLNPAQITRYALAADASPCEEAVAVFCSVLGGVARDVALTIGARGGVYLGGGIVPRLGDFLHRSGFRQRFEQGGRLSGYLAAIPTFVIHSQYPALTGVALALDASMQAFA